MKKWLIISLAIVLVAGIVLLISHEPKISDSNYGNDAPGFTEGATEEDCDVEFTEYLIEPKYVQKLGQIGVVHGFGKSIVERSYISIKEEFRGEEIKIPIYAPGDMVLVSGSRYKMPGSPDDYIPDYVLKFDAGCNIEMILGHLKDVNPKISGNFNQLMDNSQENEIRPPVNFEAGELIGYYIQQDGEGKVGGFDFITRNTSMTNKFLNQPRYDAGQSNNLRTGVCPYNFYVGEKKDAYYSLFGGGGGTIFKVKECGSASRDVAGTISGMWFLDKEIVGSIYDYYMEGDYGSPISIVGDEERIALGNLGQKNLVTYIYSNNPTYKLPIEITDEHCYQIYENFQSQEDGYVYFKVIDDMTMDVSYSSTGKCPSSMPSGGRRYYK